MNMNGSPLSLHVIQGVNQTELQFGRPHNGVCHMIETNKTRNCFENPEAQKNILYLNLLPQHLWVKVLHSFLKGISL